MMSNIKLSWLNLTLALIPLCFVVDFIVGDSNHKDATVFMLVIMSYSMPFYYRRTQIPTLASLIAFYVVSIVGAVVILFGGVGWVILVVIVLAFLYSATTILTKYGKEMDEKIDKEKQEIKGMQLIAIPAQREINKSHIYDTFIFIVLAILFLLAKEHFTQRYDMIHKDTPVQNTKYKIDKRKD